MRNLFILLLAILALPMSASAQDVYADSLAPKPSDEVDYANEITQNLCAYAMNGRGYGKGGNKAAADYIVSQFKEIGIDPVGSSYMQPFYVSANTFPNRMTLQLNSNYLVAGTDFMIDPSSPSVSGSYDAVVITRAELNDAMTRMNKIRDARGNFIIVDNTNYEGETRNVAYKIDQLVEQFKTDAQIQVKGVIIYDTVRYSKMIWSTSDHQGMRPVFYVGTPQDIESIRKVKVQADAAFVPQTTTYNVVAIEPGTVYKDSFIVISCHYDHLGTMGEAVYPGANCSASGVAMMLQLAKHFHTIKPKYTMVYIAFSGHELDMAGGKTLIKYPPVKLKNVQLVLDFDLMGNGSSGIKVVNGNNYQELMQRMVKLAHDYKFVPEVDLKRNAKQSESYLFHELEIPSFFIYSVGGSFDYKNMKDTPQMLPYTRFAEMQSLITRFLETIK